MDATSKQPLRVKIWNQNVTWSAQKLFVRHFVVIFILATGLTLLVMANRAFSNVFNWVMVTQFAFSIIFAGLMTYSIKRNVRLYVKPILDEYDMTAQQWASYLYALNRRTLPKGDFKKAAFCRIVQAQIAALHRGKYKLAITFAVLGILNIWVGVSADKPDLFNLFYGTLAIIFSIVYPVILAPRYEGRMRRLITRAEHSESAVI